MLAFAIWAAGRWSTVALSQDGKLVNPGHISKFDLATPDDLLFSYLLAPLFESTDARQWGIMKDLRSQVGGWVDDSLAIQKIADTISSAMPLEGQPPLRQLDQIVSDCAKILHLRQKLTVYVRNTEVQRVYSFNTSKESFLVVTSGLLKLYDKRPNELRFVIGRELGHLKADHDKMRQFGLAVLALIQAVDASIIPDKFQNALPTLAFGRFLSWLRESEITADRAGLLCCQNPAIAYSAMIRQLHGLPDGNSYLDPANPEFDEDAIIRNFQQWQYQPLVKFIVHAKRFSADTPFVPDRLASLKTWVKSGKYAELLNRPLPDDAAKILTVETIVLRNIAIEGAKVYPYVIAKSDKGAELFRTKTGLPASDVQWLNINASLGSTEAQPIFFEVWESRKATDRLLGGFCIQPVQSESQYNVRLIKDWAGRTTDVNPSFVKLKVRVEDRQTK
jgi:Zn-dependent protease with chaperone function